MPMPNECLELRVAKSHHQDLIREVAEERKAREALRGRAEPGPFYTRTLRWVGQR